MEGFPPFAPDRSEPCSRDARGLSQGGRRTRRIVTICSSVNPALLHALLVSESAQPPDLTDPQSDHGSTDGDVFNNIKRGLPPTMMPGYDGRIPDEDIWNIVNYLRTPSAKQ